MACFLNSLFTPLTGPLSSAALDTIGVREHACRNANHADMGSELVGGTCPGVLLDRVQPEQKEHFLVCPGLGSCPTRAITICTSLGRQFAVSTGDKRKGYLPLGLTDRPGLAQSRTFRAFN